MYMLMHINVGLFQEIRVGEITVIRSLFERVICLELPARKMKVCIKTNF